MTTTTNSTSTQGYTFSLTREEIPVTLERPGDPAPWECVLREMDGFQRDSFLNSQKGQVRVQTREITDFKDLQARLIAMCLVDKATDTPVEIKIVRGFPAKVQGQLYNLCVKLNALSEQAELEAKND